MYFDADFPREEYNTLLGQQPAFATPQSNINNAASSSSSIGHPYSSSILFGDGNTHFNTHAYLVDDAIQITGPWNETRREVEVRKERSEKQSSTDISTAKVESSLMKMMMADERRLLETKMIAHMVLGNSGGDDDGGRPSGVILPRILRMKLKRQLEEEKNENREWKDCTRQEESQLQQIPSLVKQKEEDIQPDDTEIKSNDATNNSLSYHPSKISSSLLSTQNNQNVTNTPSSPLKTMNNPESQNDGEDKEKLGKNSLKATTKSIIEPHASLTFSTTITEKTQEIPSKRRRHATLAERIVRRSKELSISEPTLIGKRGTNSSTAAKGESSFSSSNLVVNPMQQSSSYSASTHQGKVHHGETIEDFDDAEEYVEFWDDNEFNTNDSYNNISKRDNNIFTHQSDKYIMTQSIKPSQNYQPSLCPQLYPPNKDRTFTTSQIETYIVRARKALVEVQRQLYRGEERYFAETDGHGNLFKGWDTFIDAKLDPKMVPISELNALLGRGSSSNVNNIGDISLGGGNGISTGGVGGNVGIFGTSNHSSSSLLSSSSSGIINDGFSSFSGNIIDPSIPTSNILSTVYHHQQNNHHRLGRNQSSSSAPTRRMPVDHRWFTSSSATISINVGVAGLGNDRYTISGNYCSGGKGRKSNLCVKGRSSSSLPVKNGNVIERARSTGSSGNNGGATSASSHEANTQSHASTTTPTIKSCAAKTDASVNADTQTDTNSPTLQSNTSTKVASSKDFDLVSVVSNPNNKVNSNKGHDNFVKTSKAVFFPTITESYGVDDETNDPKIPIEINNVDKNRLFSLDEVSLPTAESENKTKVAKFILTDLSAETNGSRDPDFGKSTEIKDNMNLSCCTKGSDKIVDSDIAGTKSSSHQGLSIVNFLPHGVSLAHEKEGKEAVNLITNVEEKQMRSNDNTSSVCHPLIKNTVEVGLQKESELKHSNEASFIKKEVSMIKKKRVRSTETLLKNVASSDIRNKLCDEKTTISLSLEDKVENNLEMDEKVLFSLSHGSSSDSKDKNSVKCEVPVEKSTLSQSDSISSKSSRKKRKIIVKKDETSNSSTLNHSKVMEDDKDLGGNEKFLSYKENDYESTSMRENVDVSPRGKIFSKQISTDKIKFTPTLLDPGATMLDFTKQSIPRKKKQIQRTNCASDSHDDQLPLPKTPFSTYATSSSMDPKDERKGKTNSSNDIARVRKGKGTPRTNITVEQDGPSGSNVGRGRKKGKKRKGSSVTNEMGIKKEL